MTVVEDYANKTWIAVGQCVSPAWCGCDDGWRCCVWCPDEALDACIAARSASVQAPAFLNTRFIDETLGIARGSHTRCDNNVSRISHANKPGFSCFKRKIRLTTVGVATCCKHKKKHYQISLFFIIYHYQIIIFYIMLCVCKSIKKLWFCIHNTYIINILIEL
jgi:hypothetical protein